MRAASKPVCVSRACVSVCFGVACLGACATASLFSDANMGMHVRTQASCVRAYMYVCMCARTVMRVCHFVGVRVQLCECCSFSVRLSDI